MTLTFVTFANTSYMHPSRILEEAHEFGVFTSIQHKTEHDIQEFVNKHKSFIESHPQGYGCWIWKPKVILDSLLSLQPDDILVYCDAGMKLNKPGLPRFHEYMEILQNPDNHMVTFSMNESHVPQLYVKADAVAEYFPEFQDSSRYMRYCYAGLLMLKRTEKTIQLLKDWLSLCENYHYIDRNWSVRGECPNFQGNDCDNGLFNLVLAKHSIHATIYPDETNLYLPDGRQNLSVTDWSSLDRFPFQYRRLAPRIGLSNTPVRNRNEIPGIHTRYSVLHNIYSKSRR